MSQARRTHAGQGGFTFRTQHSQVGARTHRGHFGKHHKRIPVVTPSSATRLPSCFPGGGHLPSGRAGPRSSWEASAGAWACCQVHMCPVPSPGQHTERPHRNTAPAQGQSQHSQATKGMRTSQSSGRPGPENTHSNGPGLCGPQQPPQQATRALERLAMSHKHAQAVPAKPSRGAPTQKRPTWGTAPINPQMPHERSEKLHPAFTLRSQGRRDGFKLYLKERLRNCFEKGEQRFSGALR